MLQYNILYQKLSYGSFDTTDVKATITRDVRTTYFIVHWQIIIHVYVYFATQINLNALQVFFMHSRPRRRGRVHTKFAATLRRTVTTVSMWRPRSRRGWRSELALATSLSTRETMGSTSRWTMGLLPPSSRGRGLAERRTGCSGTWSRSSLRWKRLMILTEPISQVRNAESAV